MKVLFVCLGNICRSPAAEAVLDHLVQEKGLQSRVVVDSAGTGDWHVGERPDARMRAAGERRGYRFTHRARQFKLEDFAEFDLVVVMDDANWRDVLALAPDGAARAKVRRMRDFCLRRPVTKVPDPYHGGPEGFEQVLDILEDGCGEIMRKILTVLPVDPAAPRDL